MKKNDKNVNSTNSQILSNKNIKSKFINKEVKTNYLFIFNIIINIFIIKITLLNITKNY